MRTLSIGLFGCGVVGSGVVRILQERSDQIAEETGIRPEIAHICLLHPDKQRPVDLDGLHVTTSATDVLNDPEVDVIVELIGGERDALRIITEGLAFGKDVVTANKLVVANYLPGLRKLEDHHGGRLLYGASVCGSVPILKVIEETLATDTIRSVTGVLNGSTNFILGRLAEGLPREEALAIARREGFLEADPTLDVSGADAAQKLSILAWHAFGQHIRPENIPTTGIMELTPDDFEAAHAQGKKIKLVAEAVAGDKGIELSVAPRSLPGNSPLALVDDEINLVEVECDQVGTQRFIGKGAGSLPTANAVVSDLLDIIAQRRYRRQTTGASVHAVR